MREFTVFYGDRSYNVTGDPWTTLEGVWLSQKCWFSKGVVVTIMDDQGNTQTFVKE